MRIIATPLTSGPVTPGYEQLGKPYRWRKTPGWTPGDARFREEPAPPPPATVAKAAARAERIAEFARHRKDGLSIPEAGRRVGITVKTAYVYERESKALGEAGIVTRTPIDPAAGFPRAGRGARRTLPRETAGRAAPVPPPVTGAALKTPAGAGLNADSAAPAGLQGARTFTIALPAGLELLSLNDRIHFGARYRRSQDLKKAACVMALKAKVPRLERVSIVVEYQPRDRRHRDPDNIAASAKALIDGLRAARILPEDDSRHVAEVTCRIGELYPKGRLVLFLTEVAATGDAA